MGRWPLPAVFCWVLSGSIWALCLSGLQHLVGSWPAAAGLTPHVDNLAFGVAAGAGALCALRLCQGGWRRCIAVLGFPLLAWASGATSGMPAVAWLLLLLPLLLAYPVRSWRDAPIFPTPGDALQGLDKLLPAPRRVLDAGCGLGHGLQALRAVWPQARLQGVEWSPLWAWLAARRCAFAKVWRGDMWQQGDWAEHDLVYLFQRPETMARAWAKAEQEMAPGSWLVSLEFEVPGQRPAACLRVPGKRTVWVYRTKSGAAPAISASTVEAGSR